MEDRVKLLSLPPVSYRPPKIPVHMNLRVTMKPLNKMIGDSLPLLKKVQTSESSSRVLGINANANAKLTGTLSRLYDGHAMILDRISRDQMAMYTGLFDLHLNRRKMARVSLEQAHETARKERDMEEHRAAAELEMDRLNRQIQDAKQSVEELLLGRAAKVKATHIDETIDAPPTESKTIEKQQTEASNSQDKQKPESEPLHLPIISVEKVPEQDMKSLTTEYLTAVPEDSVEAGQISGHRSRTKRASVIRRESKVVHATKATPEPVTSRKVSLQPMADNIDRADPTSVVHLVSDANKTVSATITTSTGAKQLKQSKQFEVSDVKNTTERADVAVNEDSMTEKQPTPKSEKVGLKQKKVMTLSEQNRARLRFQEREMRRVLEEPYQVYTKNGAGKVVPLKHLPSRPSWNEPSNKSKYWCRKVVKSQRRDYLQRMHAVDVFGENFVSQDRTNSGPHSPAQPRVPGGGVSRRRFGQLSPSSALFRSLLPVDIAPGTSEARVYTKNLLKYGPDLANELRELPLDELCAPVSVEEEAQLTELTKEGVGG